MRHRPLLTVTAALAATVVALSAGSAPALASTTTLREPIRQAYQAATLPAVVSIFQGVQADLLSELDKLTVAGARDCARRHAVELAGVPQLPPTAAQAWASDATACVSLIDGHLATTTAQATVDKLGLAANAVGAMALAARAHAGLANDALRRVLSRANKAVLRAIPPTCYEGPVYLDDDNVYELWFVCYAYTYPTTYEGRAEAYQLFYLDDTPVGPPVDKERIRIESTKHTSWALAAAVLPLL